MLCPQKFKHYIPLIDLNMKTKFNALFCICKFISIPRQNFINPSFPKTSYLNKRLFSTETLTNVSEGVIDEKVVADYQPKNSTEVLVNWGCTENDISLIFHRRPCLRNTNPISLQSKLSILRELGLTSLDLRKIVNTRPRFLSCCINQMLKERLDYLEELFGSREMLKKAIVRNPSFLVYDFNKQIKPAVEMFDKMGVTKKDLVPMLISYPTLIPRTIFNDDKMEYIRKTGLSKDSKLYKYVVCIIGISRLETIREKVANFGKFGFQDDEILQFIGRSPLLLTLSVEKIQRNMTFVLGTMKLSASVILDYPFLLYCNLETVLKPRVLLAGKIQDMGLQPEIIGPALLRALRMKEDRFAKAFILCHPEDVANELMEYYTNVKRVKRLAESSKKIHFRGFPF